MIPLSVGCELPHSVIPPTCIFHCPQLSQLLPAWTTWEASTPLQPMQPSPNVPESELSWELGFTPLPPSLALLQADIPIGPGREYARVGTVHS